MVIPLLLSSVAAGLIATSVMLFFLYLPLLWQGKTYDVLGAIGSFVTKDVSSRSRFIGTIIYYAGGMFFAFLYGWAVIYFIRVDAASPRWSILPDLPVDLNLFYPAIGLAIGLGHGVLAGLFAVIFFTEHHPLERYRTRFTLVISQLLSHIVFGVTVTLFQHQFLQLLLRGPV